MEKIYSLILPKDRSIKNKFYSLAIIFAILLSAAFLRLFKISEYMTFLGDEGRDVLVVRHILQGKLTLLGPTASVGGFFLGPIYYYFMVPFLFLFNYNPVGPAVMVALFGIVTVWLVYKIASGFFNEGTGIIAAFLYAISPLVIAYSRSSWNPNPLPFFSLLTIYFIFLATEKNKFKYFFLTGVCLGVAMQLHYLSIFLFVIVIIYIFLARILYFDINNYKQLIRRIINDVFYILTGFIIGFSTFLAFEVRHGFPNIKSIFKFILFSRETGASGNFLLIIKDVFFRLFGRLVGNFPPPEQITLQNNVWLALWYYFILLTALLSSALLIFKFVRSLVLKEKSGKKYLLLSIWLVVGIALFGFYRKSIYDYYFGFMFPLPFLIVSALLVFLWKRKNILGKIFTLFALLFLIFINLKGFPFKYAANRQLDQVEKIARFIFDKTNGQAFNLALITGGNSDHAYRYFLELWGKAPTAIQNFAIDPKRTSVTNSLFVICETIPCYPLGNSLWEIAGFGRATISGEWDVSVVKIYKLNHYRE